MVKIINNVLTTQDCFSLYEGLVSDNLWSLNRRTNLNSMGGSFPGVSLIEDNKIVLNNQYWIGYFNCLFDRINQKLLEQHNFNLIRKIKRIGLNAQNDNHYTEFHKDSNENNYSIVGFFTPQWAEEWGGELNIEGKVIKYNPGDFILFESTKLHQSKGVKKIPYWRTSVSYMIEK